MRDVSCWCKERACVLACAIITLLTVVGVFLERFEMLKRMRRVSKV